MSEQRLEITDQEGDSVTLNTIQRQGEHFVTVHTPYAEPWLTRANAKILMKWLEERIADWPLATPTPAPLRTEPSGDLDQRGEREVKDA